LLEVVGFNHRSERIAQRAELGAIENVAELAAQ
jgi:hypothetical protein